MEYHILPLRPIHLPSLELYDQAFDFWRTSWLKTFGELEGLKHLPSDDFLRQNEVAIITHNAEIIALFAHSWFDLRLKATTEHTYFKHYPKECLKILAEQNMNRVMTMGWLAVAPAWRKSEKGPLVSETIIWQAYQRFVESDADTLIAYTRNDRKMNAVAYQYGSQCLRKGLSSHNVEVDLVFTRKEDVRPPSDLRIRATAERLWNSRIVHVSDRPSLQPQKIAA